MNSFVMDAISRDRGVPVLADPRVMISLVGEEPLTEEEAIRRLFARATSRAACNHVELLPRGFGKLYVKWR